MAIHPVEHQALNMLGSLLADENLNYVIGNYKTAKIDVVTRTIYLPDWGDETQDLSIMLRAHEVGHALRTPAQGLHDAVMEKYSKEWASYLNVIEDVRNDYLMQCQLPGLQKYYKSGYEQLIQRGFFNGCGDITKVDSWTDWSLGNRINIHSKCKLSGIIPEFFNDTERKLIRAAYLCRTYEDVVKVARRVYEYDKARMKDLPTVDVSPPDSEDTTPSGDEGGEDIEVVIDPQNPHEPQDDNQDGSWVDDDDEQEDTGDDGTEDNDSDTTSSKSEDDQEDTGDNGCSDGDDVDGDTEYGDEPIIETDVDFRNRESDLVLDDFDGEFILELDTSDCGYEVRIKDFD